MALTRGGKILRHADLTEDFAQNPKDEWAGAELWRTHFHVPVDAERLGVLGTTRAELRKALAAVAALDYQPHLEVETYTWPVLPGSSPTAMVDGLARELIATREMLASPQA